MSFEGWVPNIGEYLTLAEVIDFAFDYRGNVTVVKTDSSEIVGYLFNRVADSPEPFIQIFAAAGGDSLRILYSEIATIKFTGRDMASGKSYAAWIERREREGRLASRGTRKE